MREASAAFFSRVADMRLIVLTLMSVVLVIAGSTMQASANPRYAAVVIDAKTGKVLFERNADARRYPASLTKMMTVYMLFEAMESGRITKDTRIPISAKAAAEPPTKMGLRAGSTISVDHAIKALVTRSANDISTAVAEFLGGSEQSFARMTTAKAKQLGMRSTQFRNAHGLPNTQQYTTARDMATLGIALREHFPRHYAYFSTRSFQFGKRTISTHNRLLGNVRGVDGIKTGYTRASGFNLVSSVEDNGRSIVAVVMGGQSGSSRDQHMVSLIRTYLPKASRNGSGNLIAARRMTPSANAVAVAGIALPNSNIPTPSFRPDGEIDVQVAAYVQAQPNAAVAAASAAILPSRPVPPAPVPVPTPTAATRSSGASIADAIASAERMYVDKTTTGSIGSNDAQSGWAVQVASSTSQNEAFSTLIRVGKEGASVLTHSNAFIEEFNNKGTTYYRARFAFNSKDSAWDACNALKRQKIDCYASAL